MSTEENTQHAPADLVVVGSSAGGIGALSVLVGALPADFAAPVVIAQHLDPHRPSHLNTVLERRSTLPVVVVPEGDPTPLDAGRVYVVPSNRHVRIVDGHVALEDDHGGRPRPSVDLLLSTAARAYGEHLIAVILTGSGSDGAAGAVDVKEAGGTVIIQNPETAPYPSMPQSLPPTVVDHVADIEQMGRLLDNLLRGVVLVEPDEKTDDPLRDLLAYVSQQTNVDFRTYKPSTITRRIARRMAVTHNASLRDYAVYLETHREEVTELVKAFLIKVTGFFRDPEAFEFLRDELLPILIEQGREKGRVLRLWSAGCATGEEPYSLAILLAELLGPELPEWSVKIFATDLDESAINFARRGLYPPNVLEDLPEDLRARYFDASDHGSLVSKTLRQLVIFGHQDLSRGVPFPRIDLVVCRNLLIYLKPELQQNVLDLFAYSLHQTHGYLFLGKAETARPTKVSFEPVNKRWKIYRCTGGPMTLINERLGAPPRSLALVTAEPRASGHSALTHVTPVASAGEADVSQLRRMTEMLLRYLPIGVVVIDRSYRIVTLNGAARRMLGIRDAAPDQDFLHAARGLPYARVRDAIDTAFREHSTVPLTEVESDPAAGGASRFLNLSVMPMQFESAGAELCVISVGDATDAVQSKRRLEAIQAEQAQLLAELSAANRRLSDMNKELQDANEELQAANEELMLTQEELQATNEEFEATNEELQATNEELETNNEELQATNEELQTTNDELSARTLELQEMTQELSVERGRLAQMVEHAPLNILVLKGPSLAVQAYSPSYARAFDGDDITGRPFELLFEGRADGGASELVAAVRGAFERGESVRTPRLAVGVGGDGRGEFVHTVVPAQDASGNVEGVILYSESADADAP